MILVSSMLAMILLRILLPGLIRTQELAGLEEGHEWPGEGSGDSVRYFDFDPNTADMETLISLGISVNTARILINYREKGGCFRHKEDLKKVYGLKEKDYLMLEPYIRIEKRQVSAQVPPGISGKAGITGPGPPVRDGLDQLRHASRFDLNRADTSELQAVYGIGPVFASRIVKYRELLGGFYAMDQLREVYGLTENQFAELSIYSYTDSTHLRKLNLNVVEIGKLKQHPYLDAYQAAALLSYRKTMGAFHTLQEIPDNHLLPPEVFCKISPYMNIPE